MHHYLRPGLHTEGSSTRRGKAGSGTRGGHGSWEDAHDAGVAAAAAAAGIGSASKACKSKLSQCSCNATHRARAATAAVVAGRRAAVVAGGRAAAAAVAGGRRPSGASCALTILPHLFAGKRVQGRGRLGGSGPQGERLGGACGSGVQLEGPPPLPPPTYVAGWRPRYSPCTPPVSSSTAIPLLAKQRTWIWLPPSVVLERAEMECSASAALSNSTVPQPLLRPVGSCRRSKTAAGRRDYAIIKRTHVSSHISTAAQ